MEVRASVRERTAGDSRPYLETEAENRTSMEVRASVRERRVRDNPPYLEAERQRFGWRVAGEVGVCGDHSRPSNFSSRGSSLTFQEGGKKRTMRLGR